MILTVIVNGRKQKHELPIRWGEVNFQHYMDLFGVASDNYTKIISVFTGVDEETVKRSKIVNLDAVIHALSFMRLTPMDYSVPKEILGCPISKDLNFETTGQFKDVQAIIETLRADVKPGVPAPPLTKEQQMKYLDIVATFAMKGYCDATNEERDEFAKQFLKAPCEEVLAIGNFTYLKLIGLNLNIRPNLQRKAGRLKRLRLAMRIWVLNMAFSVRYWRLKQLPGLRDIS